MFVQPALAWGVPVLVTDGSGPDQARRSAEKADGEELNHERGESPCQLDSRETVPNCEQSASKGVIDPLQGKRVLLASARRNHLRASVDANVAWAGARVFRRRT